MKTQRNIPALLLGAVVLVTCGCPHRVVTAAMPAPMPPRPVMQNQTPPPPDPPPAIPPAADAAAQTQAPLPSPDPSPEPAAPAAARGAATPANPRTGSRPGDTDVAKAGAEAAPAAPVIAPVLSQREIANAQRATNNDQNSAQRTLTIARSHRLNAAQTDLYDKVRGFLDQTEDAKKANDWVRAQNLAHKAQVLALELMKSL